MPFHQAARPELVNATASPIPIDSTVVAYAPGPVDSTMGYLHAVARQEVRPAGALDYRMAEIHGTGHHVGNLLLLEHDESDDCMLEADGRIIVGAADMLHGTGLQDADNGGYSYKWVARWMPEPEGPAPVFAIRPLHGLLRREPGGSPPIARADRCRWMIADRVSCTRSVRASIECSYSVVGARWKSLAFWYRLPYDLSWEPSGQREGRPRSRT